MEASQHGLNFDTILVNNYFLILNALCIEWNNIEFLLVQEYFSQSKIIQMILAKNSMDHSVPHLNTEKLKRVFNSLVDVQTTTAIIDTYAELLFQSHDKLDNDRKQKNAYKKIQVLILFNYVVKSFQNCMISCMIASMPAIDSLATSKLMFPCIPEPL